MSKKKRILALILCAITLLGIIMPIVTMAEENQEENSVWNGECLITIKLDSEVTEKTDNIILSFTKKGTFSSTKKITLSRSNNFTETISLPPSTYKINFVTADNKYEVILEENYIDVPEAKMASVSLHAEKIQDNSFFVKFLRNNSLLLILLAASGITLLVIKKKKKAGMR